MPPAAPEATLDNTDPGASATGSWTSAVERPGYLGTDYAVAEGGTASDVFTWTPTVPAAGQYQVFARWPADGNRGSTATYTVTHQAGSTPVTVDQRRSGGQWVPLGAFELAPGAGHKVELSGDAEALGGPAEILVDNSAATLVGTWTATDYTLDGAFWDSDWIYHAAGTGANSATWTPAFAAAGTYRVYARWTQRANRATNAPYTVHHAGGSTTVRVNQEVNGGAWMPLGAFAFQPGQNHRVVLTDDGDGFVIADAVKLVRAPAAPAEEVVVDNAAAALAGTWTATDYTLDGPFRDADWIYHAAGTGTASASFAPALPAAGSYRVYARWTQRANRASNAPFTVHHAGGATTLRIDQRVNGGTWVHLGSYDMAPGEGHRVVLTDDADGFVIGDAVKFVYETNARAVVADAVKIVGESVPAGDFAATGSTVLREYVMLGGRPLALIENDQIQYVHPDHLGTPQKMTDAAGALVWDAVYKPFGETELITGSATNKQRFPGQVYDPETGFHYNYFRDYAPGLGRYVESDPIGLDGGLNTYLYVSANPIVYSDPTGLVKQCAKKDDDNCKSLKPKKGKIKPRLYLLYLLCRAIFGLGKDPGDTSAPPQKPPIENPAPGQRPPISGPPGTGPKPKPGPGPNPPD